MMPHAPLPLVLVAAVADNGVIGRDGALPWRLKSDLQHFRALTMGHPLLMGRKTYESIGHPLPGRTSIVVTRDRAFAAPAIIAAATLDAGIEAARGDALRRGADAIMVIGGADIYAQTMPLAFRLEITCVHANPPGDTHFPAIDPAVWREVERREGGVGQQDEAPVTFLRFERLDSLAH
jgi:dihydrofolate reductase